MHPARRPVHPASRVPPRCPTRAVRHAAPRCPKRSSSVRWRAAPTIPSCSAPIRSTWPSDACGSKSCEGLSARRPRFAFTSCLVLPSDMSGCGLCGATGPGAHGACPASQRPASLIAPRLALSRVMLVSKVG
eukprot:scaffold34595_cov51-Phaeocystis_antarctica.AAC.1